MVVLLALAYAQPLSTYPLMLMPERADPVVVLPDLNGDGTDELLLRNELYLGGPDLLRPFPVTLSDVYAAFPLGEGTASCREGLVVDESGDVHGACLAVDGFDRWGALPDDGESYWSIGAADLGDLDGDGLADFVLIESGSDAWRIRQFSGDPVDVGRLVSTALVEVDWASWAVGDFTGDGWIDLAIAESATTSTQDALQLFSGDPRGFRPLDIGHFSSGDLTALPDVDGDGRDELVIVGRSGHVRVFGGAADGLEPEPMYESRGAWSPVVAADVDGDGRLDLVFDLEIDLVVARGRAGGGFAEFPIRGWHLDDLATNIQGAFGDLNGDGCDDVVFAGYHEYAHDGWGAAAHVYRGCPDPVERSGSRKAVEGDVEARRTPAAECGCQGADWPGSAAWMVPVLLGFRRR